MMDWPTIGDYSAIQEENERLRSDFAALVAFVEAVDAGWVSLADAGVAPSAQERAARAAVESVLVRYRRDHDAVSIMPSGNHVGDDHRGKTDSAER